MSRIGTATIIALANAIHPTLKTSQFFNQSSITNVLCAHKSPEQSPKLQAHHWLLKGLLHVTKNLAFVPEAIANDSHANTLHKSLQHTDCDALMSWAVPFDSCLCSILNRRANLNFKLQDFISMHNSQKSFRYASEFSFLRGTGSSPNLEKNWQNRLNSQLYTEWIVSFTLK